ncbi:WD40-repeat-containing domain protein [Polychytrium aggregatum]|uniref:WD40-repeat-containing domain protein n=1 Tax=Polychytrium aggregatum TaxID=110093 RepID=UPI0022FEF219|nr:WD40-repeat-containing domain protein [Polychytrium aggregatum]KAI9203110.1 WD40-repeat-containing domain protein [Polychytrium aggregatum]
MIHDTGPHPSSSQLTFPEVLRFLQSQHRNYELDRSQWALDRAALENELALLRGQVTSLKQTKLDLINSVKMLEQAVRMERAKLQSLASASADPQLDSSKVSAASSEQVPSDDAPAVLTADAKITAADEVPNVISNASKTERSDTQQSASQIKSIEPVLESRLRMGEILKSYLRESQLLAHQTAASPYPPFASPAASKPSASSFGAISGLGNGENGFQIINRRIGGPQILADLPKSGSPAPSRSPRTSQTQPPRKESSALTKEEFFAEVADASQASSSKTRGAPQGVMPGDMESSPRRIAWGVSPTVTMIKKRDTEQQAGKPSGPMKERKKLETCFNESEILAKSPSPVWKQEHALRSHLDSVRCIDFHPMEGFIFTGSEDNTVKIWNLSDIIGKRPENRMNPDVEPVYTIRGHTLPVTSIVVSGSGTALFTASVDSSIREWGIPSIDTRPYGKHDPKLYRHKYVGHSDIVWEIKLHPLHQESTPLLASASSDGTVKLWDTRPESRGLKTTLWYRGPTKDGDGVVPDVSNTTSEDSNGNENSDNGHDSENGDGDGNDGSDDDFTRGSDEYDETAHIPTSIDWVPDQPNQIAVGYINSSVKIFDIETGATVLHIRSNTKSGEGYAATQINRILCHPSQPLLITASEDRHLRFYDIKNGKCLKTLLAHESGIASIDISPSGSVLVSGGHDGSVRWWDLASYTCNQEYAAHVKKNDESVWAVKYHPSKLTLMASAGADSVVKLYQFGQK